MSRQPEDLAAPPRVRPAHISAERWARATWAARQAAIDAENRRQRETADATRAEEYRIAQLRATVEAERRAHNARYHPGLVESATLADDETIDTAALIESIEQMLEWASSVHAICDSLGHSAGALEMRMRRADRPDLARVFMRVRNQSRYKPCPGCGGRCTKRARACRKCADQPGLLATLARNAELERSAS